MQEKKKASREIKGPFKFNGIQLNEEQKLAKAGVYEQDISFFTGNFGTGKTLLACNCALDLLFRKQVNKVFITRPIDFQATGYLKGSASEKMFFHLFPITQNLYDLAGKEKIDSLFGDGTIQIVPIDYLKGYTFTNSVTIVDEFEDITIEDFEVILTRLGVDSKLIFTGSEEQTSIKRSCFPHIKKLKESGLVNYHELSAQHRNTAIQKILDYLKNGKTDE